MKCVFLPLMQPGHVLQGSPRIISAGDYIYINIYMIYEIYRSMIYVIIISNSLYGFAVAASQTPSRAPHGGLHHLDKVYG